MKILIVDFDDVYTSDLRSKLMGYGRQLTIDVSRDVQHALNWIGEFAPDLVLAEHMLGDSISSRRIFRKLKKSNIDFIVVSKSKRKGAYEDVVDFTPRAFFSLPIDFIALKYHIDCMLKDKKNSVNNRVNNRKDYIVFKWNSQLRKEKFSDIDFVYAEGNFVTLYLNQKEYMIRHSLKSMEAELPSHNFIRVHRNYIVNLNKVVSIDISKNLVNLKNVQLPVGRKYKSEVKASFASVDFPPFYDKQRRPNYF